VWAEHLLYDSQAMQHVDEYYDVKRHRHADMYEPPVPPQPPPEPKPLEKARRHQQKKGRIQSHPRPKLWVELARPAQLVGIMNRNEHEGDQIAKDVDSQQRLKPFWVSSF
jgi:hypothetical protein